MLLEDSIQVGHHLFGIPASYHSRGFRNVLNKNMLKSQTAVFKVFSIKMIFINAIDTHVIYICVAKRTIK